MMSIFVEECVNSHKHFMSETRFGSRLHSGAMRSFGATELDGKADFHFLAIPEEPFETLMDHDCNKLMWLDLFSTAQMILERTYRDKGAVRYIADFGLGYQPSPKAYLNVQCFADHMPMPSLFPGVYGFSITDTGMVRAPKGADLQQEIIRIINQRKRLKGYEENIVTQRRSCDHSIFPGLKSILDKGS